MRRSFAAIAWAITLATPAWAQTKPDPFKIEDNPVEDKDFMGRTPSSAADKRVAAGPGIRGAVLEVVGKPWWQLLGYCAGVFNFRMEQAQDKGDAETKEAAGKVAQFYMSMSAKRLEADRGISFDAARLFAANEMNYNTTAAADGGEEHRPFALDEARCRDVRFGYTVTFRPQN
jgi:hypothetical protein